MQKINDKFENPTKGTIKFQNLNKNITIHQIENQPLKLAMSNSKKLWECPIPGCQAHYINDYKSIYNKILNHIKEDHQSNEQKELLVYHYFRSMNFWRKSLHEKIEDPSDPLHDDNFPNLRQKDHFPHLNPIHGDMVKQSGQNANFRASSLDEKLKKSIIAKMSNEN